LQARLPTIEAICAVVLALALSAGAQARPAAASSGPLDLGSVVQTAQHDFDLGNYVAAIKMLQSAAAQNSLSAEGYFWLGRCYYELRDYDNAVAQAEKSVALDAKNSLYHQWLARAYGGKADRERSFFLAKKVKKELQEAVRLNPANIPARIDLEDFCMTAPWIVGGNKDEARDQVDAISALDVTEGHVARGSFDLEAAKRPDLAEIEFRQILNDKPTRIDPYLEAMTFFEKQNNLPEMQSAIDAAARVNAGVNTKDPRVAYFQAVQWELSGAEPARAEEYLKAYLASTPERSDWPSHAAAREWLGRLYESQGKRVEATEQYRASLQLEPGRKEATERLQKLEKASP
jgi:tetratricopeptide (TPR) repeat protein